MDFVAAFCTLQAVMMAVHHSSQMRFYDWFYSAKELSDSGRRGLSTRGFKLFGVVSLPKLAPSLLRDCVLGYAATLCCMGLGVGGEPCRVLSLLLWLVVAGSLWAEESLSYHREVLATVTHVYLALWPTHVDAQAYGMHRLLQLHLSTIYFAACVQRLCTSLLQVNPGGLWALTSPNTFMYESSWSNYEYLPLKRLLLKHPYALGLTSGVGSWLLEAGVLPCLVFGFGGVRGEKPFLPLVFASLTAFHIAVYILQGINYASFWVPTLAVFATGGAAAPLLFALPPASASPVLDAVTVARIAAVYVFFAAQAVFAALCLESFNVNAPPLMSTPMFVTVNRMFGKPWHNISFAKEKARAGSGSDGGWLRYVQAEWNYAPLKASSGIGLDPSLVNYFSDPAQAAALQKSFVFCGIFDANRITRLVVPGVDASALSDTYFHSTVEAIEESVARCKYGRTTRLGDGVVMYYVTNEAEWFTDDVCDTFSTTLRFVRGTPASAQLSDMSQIDTLLKMQAACFRACV